MEDQQNVMRTIAALWVAVIGYFSFTYIPLLYGINLSADLSILTAFAGRMMDGMKFSEAYYETNPPLNIMIFIPVQWMARQFDWPIYHVHFYYSMFWVALSFLLTGLLLWKNKFLETHWKHLLMMCFVFTAILTPSKSFGDRDHLVYLFMVPFILVQVDMMRDNVVPKWLRVPALALGAVMVLLKPHYGILPTFLLGARIIKDRNLRFLLQGDFIALSSAVIGYAAVLLIFFPDFVFVVLPDTVELYANNILPEIKYEAGAYAMINFLCIIAVYGFDFNEKQKNLCLFLAFCSLVMIIPYAAQGKGLLYHRICFISFLYTNIAFVVYFTLLNKLPKIARPNIAPAVVVLIILFACGTFTGLPEQTMKDNEFPTYPVSEKLMEHCDEPCSYLMLYDYSDIIHQIQIYHDAFHASRFTSFWFLPLIIYSEYKISINEKPILEPEKLAYYKDKYMTMVAEDMKRFKPDVIMDFKDYEIWGERKFDFLGYFKQNPAFAKELEHYEKVDSFKFSRREYYHGYSTPYDDEPPVQFDIYKRVR